MRLFWNYYVHYTIIHHAPYFLLIITLSIFLFHSGIVNLVCMMYFTSILWYFWLYSQSQPKSFTLSNPPFWRGFMLYFICAYNGSFSLCLFVRPPFFILPLIPTPSRAILFGAAWPAHRPATRPSYLINILVRFTQNLPWLWRWKEAGTFFFWIMECLCISVAQITRARVVLIFLLRFIFKFPPRNSAQKQNHGVQKLL